MRADEVDVRELRRRRDILDDIQGLQLAAQDALPLVPNDRQIEGIAPDYAAVALSIYEAERRKRKKRTEIRRCAVCGKRWKVEVGANGRPRKHHTEACKQKAFRLGIAVP